MKSVAGRVRSVIAWPIPNLLDRPLVREGLSVAPKTTSVTRGVARSARGACDRRCRRCSPSGSPSRAFSTRPGPRRVAKAPHRRTPATPDLVDAPTTTTTTESTTSGAPGFRVGRRSSSAPVTRAPRSSPGGSGSTAMRCVHPSRPRHRHHRLRRRRRRW